MYLTWKDRFSPTTSLQSNLADIFSTQQSVTMLIEKNYDYLVNAFDKLGFGGVFEQPMKAAMLLGKPEFEIGATLDFGKSEKMGFDFKLNTVDAGDYYFMNNVKTVLSRENKPDIVHDFFLYKQQGYDIMQMKNMLEGRSVCTEFRKDGREVELWRRIDFTAQDERGNNLVRSTYAKDARFNLNIELGKLPMVNMTAADKEAILTGLKNGDRVAVTLKNGSNWESSFLEAMPHLGGIGILNAKGEKVGMSNSQLRIIAKHVGEKPELNGTTHQLNDTTNKLVEAGQNNTQGKEKDQTKQQSRKVS
ncbi:MAG: hypothetical protein JWQ30_383 [Sediminibacterium sp.]|nr:hypothetical protein [Sediminibacterium sp.]